MTFKEEQEFIAQELKEMKRIREELKAQMCTRYIKALCDLEHDELSVAERHELADQILCQALCDNGFREVAFAYNDIEKVYDGK